jgi:hypothetical protein
VNLQTLIYYWRDGPSYYTRVALRCGHQFDNNNAGIMAAFINRIRRVMFLQTSLSPWLKIIRKSAPKGASRCLRAWCGATRKNANARRLFVIQPFVYLFSRQ